MAAALRTTVRLRGRIAQKHITISGMVKRWILGPENWQTRSSSCKEERFNPRENNKLKSFFVQTKNYELQNVVTSQLQFVSVNKLWRN